MDRLRETIEILRGMWTQDVFDFHGRYYTLEENRNEPKPIQRPGPPLLIGGWGNRMMRLIAEYADDLEHQRPAAHRLRRPRGPGTPA